MSVMHLKKFKAFININTCNINISQKCQTNVKVIVDQLEFKIMEYCINNTNLTKCTKTRNNMNKRIMYTYTISNRIPHIHIIYTRVPYWVFPSGYWLLAVPYWPLASAHLQNSENKRCCPICEKEFLVRVLRCMREFQMWAKVCRIFKRLCVVWYLWQMFCKCPAKPLSVTMC